MYGHCRRQAYGIKKYYHWRGNGYIHFVILEHKLSQAREMAVKTKVNLFEMSS